MSKTRTTISINNVLFSTAQEHINQKKSEGNKEDFSNLVQRALVNQLEREGDFVIRDLLLNSGG